MRLLIPLFAVLSAIHAVPGVAQQPPDVVVIMADNLGYGDLGIYGGLKAPTPRIDELARQGVRFRDFQVEPGCTPSRAALLTGRMAVRSGNDTIAPPGSPAGLHPKEVTMAELFKRANYKTALYGKWHLGERPDRQPQNQGFDEFWGILFTSAPSASNEPVFQELGVPVQPVFAVKAGQPLMKAGELTMDYRARIDTDIAEKTIRYIKDMSRDDTPFFVFASLINPHHPVVPHPSFKGKSGGGPYADVLMEIDYNTGRILDAIEQSGKQENTIVIWMSDNGPSRYGLEPYHNGDPGPWSGELGSVFEGGLRTAGMIRWPAKIKPFVADEIFHEMDFFATLATWIDVDVPDDRPIDSIDQSAYLEGKQAHSNRDHVVVYYDGYLAAVRYRQFKFIHSVYPRWGSLQTEPQYLKHLPLLYNLRADPKERFNIAGGGEGLLWGLSIKWMEIIEAYEESFKHYPNGDYNKMTQER